METKTNTKYDWSKKIDKGSNIIVTSNIDSGMKHLKLTLQLSDEDKAALLEIDSEFIFNGESFVFEMAEDSEHFTYNHGNITHFALPFDSDVFKQAEQLALSFIKYDE